jgi:UDP-N-acetylmuramoyl-tripeptide--D-alanyl-D-alanine ligase
MLELGPQSLALHREVGIYLARRGVTYLVACGALGLGLAEGAREAGMASDRVREAPDAVAAAAILQTLVRAGDVVLLKASRGVRMERAITLLTQR